MFLQLRCPRRCASIWQTLVLILNVILSLKFQMYHSTSNWKMWLNIFSRFLNIFGQVRWSQSWRSRLFRGPQCLCLSLYRYFYPYIYLLKYHFCNFDFFLIWKKTLTTDKFFCTILSFSFSRPRLWQSTGSLAQKREES